MHIEARTSAFASCTPKTNGYVDLASKKASGATKSTCALKTPYAQSTRSTQLKSTIKCYGSILVKRALQ